MATNLDALKNVHEYLEKIYVELDTMSADLKNVPDMFFDHALKIIRGIGDIRACVSSTMMDSEVAVELFNRFSNEPWALMYDDDGSGNLSYDMDGSRIDFDIRTFRTPEDMKDWLTGYSTNDVSAMYGNLVVAKNILSDGIVVVFEDGKFV